MSQLNLATQIYRNCTDIKIDINIDINQCYIFANLSADLFFTNKHSRYALTLKTKYSDSPLSVAVGIICPKFGFAFLGKVK